MSIQIGELGDAISRELTLYNERIIEGIKKEAQKSAKQLVKDTKATAPVGNRSKHYKDSIKCKKLSENNRSVQYVWFDVTALEYVHPVPCVLSVFIKLPSMM